MVAITGRGGEVLAGYQVVARLGTWSLRDGLLTATDAEVDQYWIGYAGQKTVRVPVGKSTWLWRDADVSVAGTTLLVRVSGSPEQR